MLYLHAELVAYEADGSHEDVLPVPAIEYKFDVSKFILCSTSPLPETTDCSIT